MRKLFVILILFTFATPTLAISVGQIEYDARCAGCHGANGKVRKEKAKALKTDAGKLALHACKKNKDEMTAIIENGKGDMPAFKNKLSKKGIAAIVLYIMTLHKSPGR